MEEFYELYEQAKKFYKVNLHTRISEFSSLIEIYVNVKRQQVRVIRILEADKEIAFAMAKRDLEEWINEQERKADKRLHDHFSGIVDIYAD